jgi:DNA-directed RNA polymerase subunit beta
MKSSSTTTEPKKTTYSLRRCRKTYNLTKFMRTNQGTCINLKPIVRADMRVEEGDILCEGYATENGELALGQNLKVAFMPWKGYNFEDAIVISDAWFKKTSSLLSTSNTLNSTCATPNSAKKNSPQDIPNVSEEATKDLDENGIIRIGAWAKKATSSSAKSHPKAKPTRLPKKNCCAPSSAIKPAT